MSVGKERYVLVEWKSTEFQVSTGKERITSKTGKARKKELVSNNTVKINE